MQNNVYSVGAMVKALACDASSTLGRSTAGQVVTEQNNLAPVAEQRCPATGKVTVGLASQWPCLTDFRGLSTYGLKAYRKMSTPPIILMGYSTQGNDRFKLRLQTMDF